mmetsp:Transcript_5762/g.16383  ORF Transcript_5762/g.16383 Transcript_5762/m.16383 type:complete len:365 (+) Transcript_5762:158-1252(+)
MNTGGGAAGLLDAPQAAEAPKPKRFREPQKFLPVAFMAATICGLWAMYVFWHCVPLLQLDAVHGHVDTRARFRGTVELIAFHWFTALLLYCYVMSILVHPGEIPSQDPQWEWLPQHSHSVPENLPMSLQEMKKSGERRHCKWCGKYKPDRCHHCRVCKKCILKMDHHCPWIYNCVGFGNHKYFFLFVLYCVLDLHLVVWTMAESVKFCIEDLDVPFMTMSVVFFGESLAFFLAALVTPFFGFHTYLVLKAMTTIEFCEKSLGRKEGAVKNYDSSVYDHGFWGNIRTVLGNNALLWLLPCSLPTGDGLSFVSDETRLTLDMGLGRVIRRRTHQRTQRTTGSQMGDVPYGSSAYAEPAHEASPPSA